MPAKLKVFAARLGFFDTVVAAPSQKAALEAWGVHQDLFKEGHAAVTADPAAQAALERPGVVLRRMAGSSGAYSETAEVDAAALPADSKPAKGARGKAGPPPASAKPRPPPDRTALTAAEKALAAAEADFQSGLADLEARRRALDEEEGTLRRYHDRRLRELETTLERARLAYRRAGGAA
jgi:colicin import membrane protein